MLFELELLKFTDCPPRYFKQPRYFRVANTPIRVALAVLRNKRKLKPFNQRPKNGGEFRLLSLS